jgi:hypothetical protein
MVRATFLATWTGNTDASESRKDGLINFVGEIMFKNTSYVASLVPLLLSLSGCAVEGGIHDGGGGSRDYPQESINIPPGHMPPPGECRIWFRGRPPGQQPPPGPCNKLRYEVPPDAVLVHG